MARRLTQRQLDAALEEVAQWLGPRMGCEDGPAPTGKEAADRGEGPWLKEDWDWPGEPTPTILLEGGPDDWAVRVAGEPAFCEAMREIGVFAEPWASYALCLYPDD